MADIGEMATHAASAAGGGVTIGWVAKVLIQNWIKSHDKRADATGDAMKDVAVELAKISVKLEHLEKAVNASSMHGENIAVITARLQTVERNLNGLGTKLRSLGPKGL